MFFSASALTPSLPSYPSALLLQSLSLHCLSEMSIEYPTWGLGGVGQGEPCVPREGVASNSPAFNEKNLLIFYAGWP